MAGLSWNGKLLGEHNKEELINCINDLYDKLIKEMDRNNKPAGTWISVKEREPDKWDVYLVCYEPQNDGVSVSIFGYWQPDRKVWTDFLDGKVTIEVTHWMPLPEPPQVDNSNKSVVGVIPYKEAMETLKDAHRAVNHGFREPLPEPSKVDRQEDTALRSGDSRQEAIEKLYCALADKFDFQEEKRKLYEKAVDNQSMRLDALEKKVEEERRELARVDDRLWKAISKLEEKIKENDYKVLFQEFMSYLQEKV